MNTHINAKDSSAPHSVADHSQSPFQPRPFEEAETATEAIASPSSATSAATAASPPPKGYNFGQISIMPKPAAVQAKLTIGEPDDQYEREADAVAERVMSMPAQPPIQRQSEEEELQMKPAITPLVQRQQLPEAKLQLRSAPGSTSQPSDDLATRLSQSQGGGSPLSEDVRRFMEPRFRADFSQVRVHTGGESVQMNRELGAQAFTHGQNIYYSASKAPAKDNLTAHELTHVVQQTESKNLIQRDVVDVNPIIIATNPRTERRLQQLSDEAMRRLPSVGRTYLNEWFSAVSAGVNSIPEPSDPNADTYWWIALAGNLAWAATSLMAPEMAVLIRVMSFAGAAVGSGTVQRLTSSSVPAGKPYLVTQLARARDRMQGGLRPVIVDTAIECVQRNITDQEQQDQLLWTKLFPGVSQAHEFETLVSDSITRAGAALDEFARQYRAWRQRIEGEAYRRAGEQVREENRAFPIGEPGERAFRASLTISRAQGFIPICEGEMPFQPNLVF